MENNYQNGADYDSPESTPQINPFDNGMSVLFSPDFDAYASGKIPASAVRCVLCQNIPCNCPPFGSDAYFVLCDFRHGRISAEDPAFTRHFRIKDQ